MAWNVSAGLKKLKIAKRKVELKENVTLTEGRCTWADFLSRKTRKMHRETALEMASTSNYRSEANVHILAGYVLPLVFYKMPDRGSSVRYLCTKEHNNLHFSL